MHPRTGGMVAHFGENGKGNLLGSRKKMRGLEKTAKIQGKREKKKGAPPPGGAPLPNMKFGINAASGWHSCSGMSSVFLKKCRGKKCRGDEKKEPRSSSAGPLVPNNETWSQTGARIAQLRGAVKGNLPVFARSATPRQAIYPSPPKATPRQAIWGVRRCRLRACGASSFASRCASS